MNPLTGDIVNCDMCGKEYKYFIWAMGSDKRLCRGCVRKRPSAYLDNIDPIDIDKEQDLIYDETEEQERRDGKELKQWSKHKEKEKPNYNKMWQVMKKKTIAQFKGRRVNG